MRGAGGADTLIGGAGTDTAGYGDSAAGVTVNLALGTGIGGDAEGDTLDGIENLNGSAQADILTGAAGVNVLNGLRRCRRRHDQRRRRVVQFDDGRQGVYLETTGDKTVDAIITVYADHALTAADFVL